MLDALWTSLDIGPMRVANRIMTTGHALLYGEQGLISDRHVAYYRERARGGVGLIVTEQQAAHPAGRNYHAGCIAYDPRAVPRYAALAEAVHAEGGRVMAQLFCGGAQGSGTMYIDAWQPLLAPSAIASTQFHELPKAMDAADIRAVIARFADSARNVRDGGLDGVEIHAAHSQLLGAFLSPAWNRRTDAYGGTTEKRCRIVREIGEAVRRAAGDGLAIGLRLSVSEYLRDGAGITPEETERQLAILSATGLFDFYDLSAGGYYAKHVSVTPMASDLPEGFLAPAARRLRDAAGNRARILLVGRVLRLEHAAGIVAQGVADMVAMTRAHIADPHLVRKTREGRPSEVTRCVGANLCVRRLGENNAVACLVNPAAGREARWGAGSLVPASAASRRTILVVGGGPAGMKAAAVAAARGHRVTLAEAEPALGGHLRRLARLPMRARWQHAIDDLAGALERSGVALRLGERIDAGNASSRPDVTVLATGARFARDGYTPMRPARAAIPGSDAPHVLDIGTAVDRVLMRADALGRHVLILDEGQDVLTAGLAELLAESGARVQIVTPYAYFGETLARSYELPTLMPRLARHGVAITPLHMVEAIDPDAVRIADVWTGETRIVAPVDAVVLAQSRVPDDALFTALAADGSDVRRIGDALAPRGTEAAIHDGEAFGRAI